MVDLRLSVAAAHVAARGDSDSMCCAWKRVPAWIDSIFAWFCRSMDYLLFYGNGWLNRAWRQWI
jgi:hypothetical protein